MYPRRNSTYTDWESDSPASSEQVVAPCGRTHKGTESQMEGKERERHTHKYTPSVVGGVEGGSEAVRRQGVFYSYLHSAGLSLSLVFLLLFLLFLHQITAHRSEGSCSCYGSPKFLRALPCLCLCLHYTAIAATTSSAFLLQKLWDFGCSFFLFSLMSTPWSMRFLVTQINAK